jgi:hypothetical protein
MTAGEANHVLHSSRTELFFSQNKIRFDHLHQNLEKHFKFNEASQDD